jgi:hypothetical protein
MLNLDVAIKQFQQNTFPLTAGDDEQAIALAHSLVDKSQALFLRRV